MLGGYPKAAHCFGAPVLSNGKKRRLAAQTVASLSITAHDWRSCTPTMIPLASDLLPFPGQMRREGPRQTMDNTRWNRAHTRRVKDRRCSVDLTWLAISQAGVNDFICRQYLYRTDD
jgi:hypothetical protein